MAGAHLHARIDAVLRKHSSVLRKHSCCNSCSRSWLALQWACLGPLRIDSSQLHAAMHAAGVCVCVFGVPEVRRAEHAYVWGLKHHF